MITICVRHRIKDAENGVGCPRLRERMLMHFAKTIEDTLRQEPWFIGAGIAYDNKHSRVVVRCHPGVPTPTRLFYEL